MEEVVKFSITIPAFKAKFLNKALDSCLQQTYKNFEVIVVDDCSPENLFYIVEPFLADQRFHYFRNAKNYGAEHVVDNWNECLRLASGDWVICMGDDDMLMPNCLEEYNRLIAKYPQIDLVHSRVRQIDEDDNLLQILNERPELQSAYSFITLSLQGANHYIGDFCYRKTRLEKEGSYYKLPFAWGSDDVSAFIAASPHGVANTKIPTFSYRINSLSISKTGNEIAKIEALVKERQWLKEYVKMQNANNEVESEELERLSNSIDKGMSDAMISAIKPAIKKSILQYFYWLFYAGKYGMSRVSLTKQLLIILFA